MKQAPVLLTCRAATPPLQLLESQGAQPKRFLPPRHSLYGRQPGKPPDSAETNDEFCIVSREQSSTLVPSDSTNELGLLLKQLKVFAAFCIRTLVCSHPRVLVTAERLLLFCNVENPEDGVQAFTRHGLVPFFC